jgi:hypothetical protein
MKESDGQPLKLMDELSLLSEEELNERSESLSTPGSKTVISPPHVGQ